jgi:beta-glucanase (GH16 family)
MLADGAAVDPSRSLSSAAENLAEGDSATAPTGPAWADEFDGAAGTTPDSSRWNFDVGGNGWGNNELQYYTRRPGNAALDGKGHLVITARAERFQGANGVERDYTSARLQTLEKFEFTYGLMEARIQVPAGAGLAPAFWSLGNEAYTEDDAWPACGEIDTMEVLGSEPNILNGTVHGPWPAHPSGIGGEAESPVPLSAGFHTYGVRWETNQISFLLDGSVYETVTPADLPPGEAWPFQHPNFLLLNLAVGGDWPKSPDASTRFPARMVVDWVRVWH